MNILSDIEKMSQILGKEKIACLINLFEEINGQPPRVNKKRYRADNPSQIEALNYLEQSACLIRTETHNTQQFYYLRPYALPLIKTPKAQDLLNLMCEIYQKFMAFYKERLDAEITINEITKVVNSSDEDILAALFHFKESEGVWSGWGGGFPYEKGSHINISENVILKKDFLEILGDYYRSNFIGKKEGFLYENNKKEFFPNDVKIEDKKTGRPSLKKKIIDAYEFLKKNNVIDYSKTLKAHEKIIQETTQIEEISYKTISKYLGKRFKEDKNLQTSL